MSIASELAKLVQIFKNWAPTPTPTPTPTPDPYVLPPATANTLGGVKVGDGLEVTEDGMLSANGGANDVVRVVFDVTGDFTGEEPELEITNVNMTAEEILAAVEARKTVVGTIFLTWIRNYGTGKATLNGGWFENDPDDDEFYFNFHDFFIFPDPSTSRPDVEIDEYVLGHSEEDEEWWTFFSTSRIVSVKESQDQ